MGKTLLRLLFGSGETVVRVEVAHHDTDHGSMMVDFLHEFVVQARSHFVALDVEWDRDLFLVTLAEPGADESAVFAEGGCFPAEGDLVVMLLGLLAEEEPAEETGDDGVEIDADRCAHN